MERTAEALQGGSQKSKDHGPPLTGVAFTVLVLLAEEALAVETGHLVPWLDVPEHFHAGCVSICRHKLGARG